MFTKLATAGLLLALTLCAPIAEAAKIYQLADATVYLKDGTTDQYSGTTKLSMPHKTDALQRVENAYTKNQKNAGEIPCATVDSVVMWLPDTARQPLYIRIRTQVWMVRTPRQNGAIHRLLLFRRRIPYPSRRRSMVLR